MGMGSGNEEGLHSKTKIDVLHELFISNNYRLIQNDRLLRNKRKNTVAQIY